MWGWVTMVAVFLGGLFLAAMISSEKDRIEQKRREGYRAEYSARFEWFVVIAGMILLGLFFSAGG